jgi:hypothetical protein
MVDLPLPANSSGMENGITLMETGSSPFGRFLRFRISFPLPGSSADTRSASIATFFLSTARKKFLCRDGPLRR